ncbi:MAG: outer membrane lipid asymmetry maintenance protein MlaD [Methylococcaceae bacterium]|nr:outer membrane lipid asymmetry maintenance protein MlaD [Methylococcaceae bacterium]MCI0732954.1 outer membrane lipid asymmetry maintenance protein MlaD [Methylococcaceae bacterium]
MHYSKSHATWVGFFVFLGIGALFFLALQVSNLSSFDHGDGYRLVARFENIGGLKVRSPVTVSGVRIGRVSAIDYDKKTYQAVVEMKINPTYDTLPADTSAGIYTSGLLGEQYIGLEPGGAEEYLQNGDQFEYTQSALVLEEIIGQFLFSKADELKKTDEADSQ